MNRDELIDLLRNKTSLARLSEPEMHDLMDRLAALDLAIVSIAPAPAVMPMPSPVEPTA